MATKLMNEHYIPASIILGISMLESGYGTSKLSKNKNNFFGVKSGKYYRGYENDTASFKHFCEFISRKKFYSSLTKNNNIDYKIWVDKIKNTGYSESETWSSKVLFYIKKYKLYELDKFDNDISKITN
jgi:flagellum-specific peptidoglycan hydrolase FlgJ